MSKLDVTRENEIGRIYGEVDGKPGVRFELDGKFYDATGEELDDEGKRKAEEPKPKPEPKKPKAKTQRVSVAEGATLSGDTE